MGTKLGWSLRGEKNLFRRSIDLIRNGWERFFQSGKLWCGEKYYIWKKKEEKSKSKIWKDDLGLKWGYSSWKHVKGSSNRGDYRMKRVRTNRPMRNSVSKCLQEVKTIENDNLQGKKPGDQFFMIWVFIRQTFLIPYFSLLLELVSFRPF